MAGTSVLKEKVTNQCRLDESRNKDLEVIISLRYPYSQDIITLLIVSSCHTQTPPSFRMTSRRELTSGPAVPKFGPQVAESAGCDPIFVQQASFLRPCL